MCSARIGFSVQTLSEALPSDKPVRHPVTARILYGEGENGAAVWAVFDFMDFSKPFVDSIASSISAATGVPPDHVHVVTTHNHFASDVSALRLDVLSSRAAEGAIEARSFAAPASVRHACVDVQRRISYRRRLFVEELGGSATFWFGVTENDAFRADRLLRQAVRSLVLQRTAAYRYSGLLEAVPEERFIDDRIAQNPDAFRMSEGDPRLHLLVFEKENGEPIGSIVRFAVHAATMGYGAPPMYTSDFPHLLRRTLESELGGVSIFLNGPCGDISPAIGDERDPSGELVAGTLAAASLNAIRNAVPEPLRSLSDASRTVALPVNPDFPLDRASAEARIKEAEKSWEHAALGLADRRRLAEHIGWLRTTDAIRDKWRCIDSSPLAIHVALGLLRLNDIAILAFPGETFSATGEAVVSGLDPRSVITVTEHGRTAVYLPPPEEWDRGGYERSCCAIARWGEPVLRQAAWDFLHMRRYGDEK